jgi:hypothetical protein
MSSGLHAALLGPTPYLSFADSPFSGGTFSNFYLENFEGGSLATPGVTASGGVVLSPGQTVDSVDGDDGTIDGLGTQGHSFYINTSNTLIFTFNAAALGGQLPTHAGIVWTDIGLNGTATFGVDGVSFAALDENGDPLGSIGPFTLGDGVVTGATAEDRFFGVTNATGISQIQITMANSLDWEVDHLQYRIASTVPEPSTWLCAMGGLSALLLRGRRRQ